MYKQIKKQQIEDGCKVEKGQCGRLLNNLTKKLFSNIRALGVKTFSKNSIKHMIIPEPPFQ
jgi:hypothetical protein